MKSKVIFFSPHPNDAVLGCGGSIAKKTAEGCEVLIVFMTDGRFLLKQFGIDDDPSPEQVKAIRREEAIRTAKILGVQEENLFFLDFIDGTLKEYEDKALEKVTEILRSFPPSEIYCPFERDCHPDHQATSRIVKKAIKELGITTRMYRYIIMHKFARFGPFIEGFLGIFKRDRLYVNVSNFLALKRNAVKEFKSDLMAISPKKNESRVIIFEKFLTKWETFYISK